MNDPEGPREEGLEEEALEANSNMQRLLEAIGQLISASRSLLARLQPGKDRPPPDDKGNGDSEA